jgi:periodic tryptophan protein 1
VVLGYDTRKPDGPVFELKAHEKACTNVSFSPHIPNMMATCSTDEYVKIWNVALTPAEPPKLVGYKKMSTMGELFSLSYYKDIPWVLAAGGSKGEVAVWDTEENEEIAKHFGGSLDSLTQAPES